MSLLILTINLLALTALGAFVSYYGAFWRERAPRFFPVLYALPPLSLVFFNLGFMQEWAIEPSADPYWFYSFSLIFVLICLSPMIVSLSSYFAKNKGMARGLGTILVILAFVPYFQEPSKTASEGLTKLYPSTEGVRLAACEELNTVQRSVPLLFPLYEKTIAGDDYCVVITDAYQLPRVLGFRPSIVVISDAKAGPDEGFFLVQVTE